jgi:hypothetical protein
MSTATLDFESYAIVATNRVSGKMGNGWMISSRTGAVVTNERIGNYETSLEEAKEIAAAKFPDRDIFGPDDPKPWD